MEAREPDPDRRRDGRVLGAIENADLETLFLNTNRQFLDLIERSRAQARVEGGSSSEEMRRRFERPPAK